MKKHKLIQSRKTKGLSQQQIADLLHMDVSNYNRREKGKSHIKPDEWLKLAEFLDVNLDDIYEPDNQFQISHEKYSFGLKKKKFELFSIPRTLLDTQHKYILSLESKIKNLEDELKKLK